jgi:nucleotide-binding universal stress UspA family protein
MGTIVVATDGSELATQAATIGLSLMKPVDRVLVVTVADEVDPSLAWDATGHAGPTMTYEEVEAHQQRARAASEAVVSSAVAALGSLPGPVEPRVVQGPAGPTLCELAADEGADAIIVGSHGRSGFRRVLMGSVSDYVVRHAPCSVIVTRS